MSRFLLNSIFSPHFMQLSVICLLVFFFFFILLLFDIQWIFQRSKKKSLEHSAEKKQPNSQKLKMHRMQIYFPQNTYHRDRLLVILLFIHIVILNQCTLSFPQWIPDIGLCCAILCYSVMCSALHCALRYVSMVLCRYCQTNDHRHLLVFWCVICQRVSTLSALRREDKSHWIPQMLPFFKTFRIINEY